MLESLKLDYFSPKDHNLCLPGASNEERHKAYQRNLDEIDKSDFIIVNTEKKDLGSIHESGYANKAGVPIIYFNKNLKGSFNLMLSLSGMCVCANYQELLKAIQRFIKEGKFYEEYKGRIE